MIVNYEFKSELLKNDKHKDKNWRKSFTVNGHKVSVNIYAILYSKVFNSSKYTRYEKVNFEYEGLYNHSKTFTQRFLKVN